MATTTGVSGPPIVMYFLRTEADQHQTRDSLAAAFLLYVPLSVAALAVGGRLGLGDVGAAELAGLLALILVGRTLGRALFLRLSEARVPHGRHRAGAAGRGGQRGGRPALSSFSEGGSG